MKIYRQHKGEETEKIVSLDDMLKYAEESGYWQKGTALEALKKTGQIHTPFAIYYLKNKSVMTNTLILTRKEVMEMLDISPATLWRWCKTGKIKSFHMGGRVYFKHDDIMNSLIEY